MHSISQRETERRVEQSRRDIAARLNVNAAAEYCGVSTSYLNKLRCTGGGPAYLKLGSRIVYSTDLLDAWMAAGRRTSTRDAQVAA
jgi:hypothetical protein